MKHRRSIVLRFFTGIIRKSRYMVPQIMVPLHPYKLRTPQQLKFYMLDYSTSKRLLPHLRSEFTLINTRTNMDGWPPITQNSPSALLNPSNRDDLVRAILLLAGLQHIKDELVTGHDSAGRSSLNNLSLEGEP